MEYNLFIAGFLLMILGGVFLGTFSFPLKYWPMALIMGILWPSAVVVYGMGTTMVGDLGGIPGFSRFDDHGHHRGKYFRYPGRGVERRNFRAQKDDGIGDHCPGRCHADPRTIHEPCMRKKSS